MAISLRHGELELSGPPLVMGILNVTPDSFSDGGQFLDPDAALRHAQQMIGEGAAVIDVGGESTRPGAAPVPDAEQLRRVVPLIRSLRSRHPRFPVSIDTRSAIVAAAALEAGADMINDVSALRDDADMGPLAARTGAAVVLMHMRGTPADMQRGGGPCYADVVGEIRAFLLERAAWAQAHGVERDRILIDPGIGFGKRVEDNLRLLACLGRFVDTGFPVLVGASRKSLIAVAAADAAANRPSSAADRLGGSLACAALAALAGAAVVRAHDVAPTVQAVRVAAAVRKAAAG